MKNLEVRLQNKVNVFKYEKNNSQVITFLRHCEDKIIISNTELIAIEIIHNGESLFLGDKYELYEILKKHKQNEKIK